MIENKQILVYNKYVLFTIILSVYVDLLKQNNLANIIINKSDKISYNC